MEKNVVAVLVFLSILAMNGVNAQIYTCWGGCYNECFLRSKKTGPERLACYFQCINSCVPNSPADFTDYCQIGCSLTLCSLFSFDGERLEKCFGNCDNLCKFDRI